MKKTVLELKTEAKNLRDFGIYDDAVDCINEAIKNLSSCEESDEIMSELADCYGILGGLYRRWALDDTEETSRLKKFILSLEAYNKGYSWEKQTNHPGSYNLLNRLVGEVFVQPEILHNTGGAFNDSLREAEQIIQRQLDTYRRKDIWALADLFLIKILLQSDADVTLDNFIREAPPQFVYKSLLSAMKPLAELETIIKPNMTVAIDTLAKHV